MSTGNTDKWVVIDKNGNIVGTATPDQGKALKEAQSKGDGHTVKQLLTEC